LQTFGRNRQGIRIRNEGSVMYLKAGSEPVAVVQTERGHVFLKRQDLNVGRGARGKM
jgi:hypothetical protein